VLGKLVLCDRFYDSTTAYQGYGRGLDLDFVKRVVNFAVGETRPNLTLLLQVPLAVSEERRAARQSTLPFLRDRMEEADREFFKRVANGFEAIAAAEPQRIRTVDAMGSMEEVRSAIWKIVEPQLPAIK